MAFCFHAGEAVRESIRRIGTEQIDALLFDLGAGADARRIHDARKRCKMLRALLLLTRSGLDAATRRADTKRWRDIAHSLGRARDAEVRLETFHSIVSRPNSCRDLAAQLQAEAEAAGCITFDAAVVKRLIARINAGKRAWAKLPFSEHGWPLIETGLHRSYREARTAFKAIRDDSPDDLLHEWRKRVKTIWYHTRLLVKVRPNKLKPLATSLERLGELLGADHDLAMLRAYAVEHEAHCLDVLDPLIAHRRRTLQRKARALAGTLFEERPRDFTEQLRRWWKDWRN